MEALSAPPESWDCSVVISSIDKGGEPYTDELDLEIAAPIELYGQLYEPVGPLEATIEANTAGERIIAHVSVSGKFAVPCSRCLEPTELAIFGDLRYLFSLPSAHPAASDDDDEDDDDDVDVIEIDAYQREIDFAPYIWEVLLLALPERALCREDCRGLCPICGTDLNKGDCGCRQEAEDPRFDALRGALEEMKK